MDVDPERSRHTDLSACVRLSRRWAAMVGRSKILVMWRPERLSSCGDVHQRASQACRRSAKPRQATASQTDQHQQADALAHGFRQVVGLHVPAPLIQLHTKSPTGEARVRFGHAPSAAHARRTWVFIQRVNATSCERCYFSGLARLSRAGEAAAPSSAIGLRACLQ